MSGNEEPDWLAELAKGGEAARRQIEPIVEAAHQFVHDAQRARASGSTLPFVQRVALAVNAGMRELLPRQPVAHRRTASLTVTPNMTATATVTASFNLAMPPMHIVALGDVAAATEAASVRVLDSHRSLADRIDGRTTFLALVWLSAVVLPWLAANVPPEQQGILSDSLSTFALALAITWRIHDNSK
jgi:hypothetical protein